MKLNWRSGIALVIGGVVLGSIVSAVANENGSTRARDGGPPHRGFVIKGGKMIRTQGLREGDTAGQFITDRMDEGFIKAIDGQKLTINEADGTVVDVTVNDATTFYRDDQEAKLSDLKVGDRVMTHREKTGSAGFVTDHVMAFSAERWKQMEAQREACQKDESVCRAHHPAGGMRGGHMEPASEPSTGSANEKAA